MKRIIGFALISSVVLILFGVTAVTHGLAKAAFAWGLALTLTGMVALGAWLAVSDAE